MIFKMMSTSFLYYIFK